jgi:uncharacterized protein
MGLLDWFLNILGIKQVSFYSITKLFLQGLLVSMGLVFLDGVWIRALPKLGISYGGTRSTLALLIFLRGIIFFFWSVLLIGIAVSRSGVSSRFTIWLLVGLNILLLGLGLYSFYIEPMHLSVGRFEMQVPGLRHSIRIVQLSDMHVTLTTRRDLALPGLVASLQPDMIVMTGDYSNGTHTDLRKLVGQMHAPLGIYAVNGNVETPLKMQEQLDGLGVFLLENDVIRVPEIGDHFVIIGLDYIDPQGDELNLRNLMNQVHPGDFTLLLYHKPDLAYAARDLHVNLYLAGHTHGGQVRLPFYGAIYSNSRYDKTFEMGLYHLDETTLYVSRGLGMKGWMPQVRFLASPEVVVVDLVPGD